MTSITALNVRLGMDASDFVSGADLARREVNRVATVMRQSEPAALKYQRDLDLLNRAFSEAGKQSERYSAALDFLAKRHQQGQYSAEAVAKAQQAKAAADAAAAEQARQAAAIEAEAKRRIAAEEARLAQMRRDGEAVMRSVMTAQQRHAAEIQRLGGLLKGQAISQEAYNRAVARLKTNAAIEANRRLQASVASLASEQEKHDAKLRRHAAMLRGAREEAQRSVQPYNQLALTVGRLAGAYLSFQGIKSGLAIASDIEQAAIAFEVMTGSAEAGKKTLEDLRKFAAATPLTLSGSQQAAKTLLAFGVSADKVMPTLRMLGDVSGGNQERFQSLALAFGQTTAAGRLMGQEVLQLVNAGFNPLQEISRTTGLSMADLKKQMENGAISAEMVTRAFESATGPGGRFFGMMDRMSSTALGSYNQLISSIQEIVAQVGQHFLPMLARAAKSIESVVKATSGFISGLDRSQAQTLAMVGAFSSVVIVVPRVIGAISAVRAAIKLMTQAQVTSLAFTGPKGWAVIAAGAAAAALAVNEVNAAFDKMEESARAANESGGKGVRSAADTAKTSAASMAASVSPLEQEFLKMEHGLNEQVKLLNLGEAAYRRQQMYAKGMSIAQVQRIEQLHQEVALAEERNRKQKEAEDEQRREIKRMEDEAKTAFTRDIGKAIENARKYFEDEAKRQKSIRDAISKGPESIEVGSEGAASFMADRVNSRLGEMAVPDRPTPGERELLAQAHKELAELQKVAAESAKQNASLRQLIGAVEANAVRRIR